MDQYSPNSDEMRQGAPEFRSLEESGQVGEHKSGPRTEVFSEGLGHQSALHCKD